MMSQSSIPEVYAMLDGVVRSTGPSLPDHAFKVTAFISFDPEIYLAFLPPLAETTSIIPMLPMHNAT